MLCLTNPQWSQNISYEQYVMTVLDRGLLNLIYIPRDLRNLTLVCDIRFFYHGFVTDGFVSTGALF